MKVGSLMKYIKILLVTITLLITNITTSFGQQNIPNKNLEVVQAVAPKYPDLATIGRVSGTVNIEVLINENGDVISLKTIDGPALLRKSSELSAKQWKFKSTDSKVVSAKLTFIFTLMTEQTSLENMLPIFFPPFLVEVKDIPPQTIDSPNIDPPLKKTLKHKKVKGRK